MPGVVSNSALDRLGRALRDGTMGPADLALLGHLREEWARGMNELVGVLEAEFGDEPIQLSFRVKNLGTLREKLARLSGGLSSVRDIIGARIVLEGSREVQDAIVGRVVSRFSGHNPRVISRVIDPRAGYRAIHVEVRLDEGRAEIQIRTRAQHEWANAMERFGDRVGRGVRYDDDSMAQVPSQVRDLARACLSSLKVWSDEIDAWEVVGSPPVGDIADRVRAAEAQCKSLLEDFNESL